VPSNQLELALWLESDRMGYLLEKVTQASLSNQQDVVRNERRQSYENQPYGLADEAAVQILFPKDHPYYGNVIGSHEDIQAVKLEDVHSFFRQYYAPNNASLAIVGDFDVAQAKALVTKYFGTFKRGPAVPPPRPTRRRSRASGGRRCRRACSCRASRWRGSRRRSSSRATPTPKWRRRCSGAAARAVSTRSWSTKADRAERRGAAVLADPRLDVPGSKPPLAPATRPRS
jgi:hypothetical protein